MRHEAIEARNKLLRDVRQVCQEAVTDFASDLADDPIKFAEAVGFQVMCILDGCFQSEHCYMVQRDDGLQLSDNGLHDYYYHADKKP